MAGAPNYVDGDALVVAETSVTPALAEIFVREYGLEVVRIIELATTSKSMMLVRSKSKSTEELIKELSSLPNVESVTPNYIISLPEPIVNISIQVGETKQLVSNILSADKNLNWRSSNEDVATVNSSGFVKGISDGMVTITVSTADGGMAEACVVVVTSASGYLSVVPKNVSIAVTGTQRLYATIVPLDVIADRVTWSSSNTAIATVDTSGLVTGISIGEATITATSVEGSLTDSSEVTVTDGKEIVLPGPSNSGGGCNAMNIGLILFAILFVLFPNRR